MVCSHDSICSKTYTEYLSFNFTGRSPSGLPFWLSPPGQSTIPCSTNRALYFHFCNSYTTSPPDRPFPLTSTWLHFIHLSKSAQKAILLLNFPKCSSEKNPSHILILTEDLMHTTEDFLFWITAMPYLPYKSRRILENKIWV